MPIVAEDKYHIPIFIIMHDRTEIPKKCINSYIKNIKSPIRLVFHDTKSVYKPGIAYLKKLEADGHTVYWDNVNGYKRVMNSVKDYLNKHKQCEYYVITDPDIRLDNVPGDILELYIFLSEKYGNLRVVGPMLRIDDIPDYYPYKKTAVNRQTRMFFRQNRQTVNWKNRKVEYIETSIDSTFQLVHRSNLKPPPRRCIRVFAPYWARHLDWYINPKKLTPDKKFYSQNNTGITHWGRNVHNKDSNYVPFKKKKKKLKK